MNAHIVFYTNIRIQKSYCQMCAAFAEDPPKANLNDRFSEMFRHVQARYNSILRRFVTIDDTQIYQKPKFYQKSRLVPKKTKALPSVGKVIATVFWYFHGIIFIYYFYHELLLTGKYRTSLYWTNRTELKPKRLIWQRKKSCISKTLNHRTNL